MRRERARTARRPRKSPWSAVENALRRQPWRKCERDLVDALKRNWNGGKHARIYRGDVKLAEQARCSPISIWRAKNYLERRGILLVTHTKGGYTRNPEGELVRAATGYEPHPDLYQAAPAPSESAVAAAPATLEEHIARRRSASGSDPP